MGLSLYTYALSYIMIPLLLLFICIYLLWCKKISFKKLIIFGIPIFLISLPLMLMILINNGYISEINGFITIPKLPLYRSEEISLENIKENSYLIKTIFSYDNPEIFSNQLIYNAIPAFGTIYYISIPLFITGFLYGIVKCFKDIKNKEFNVNTIFIFWFISILICLLFIINPNVNKANAIYIPILYFICIGIYFIIDNFKLLIIPIILLFILNFGIFFNY